MKNSMRFFGLFLVGLVLLPSCMRVPSYRCRSLKSVSNNFMYRDVEKNVVMRAKKLSEAEKSYLFDTRIRDNDLQVIYFSIHNLSDELYIFSHDGICLELVPYKNVMRILKKTNTVSRFVGVGVGATIVASPYIAASCLMGQGIPGIVLFPFIAAAMIALPLGITFLAQGIKSIVINSRITKDLTEKILDKPVIISSGEQYEGLVFVRSSDYTPQFVVRMHEKNNAVNGITFHVDLGQKN